MHRKILIDAFIKAEKEEGLVKKTHISTFLSDFIFEDSGEPYGEKILRIHYNKAIDNTDEKVELKNFAVKSLCNYLDYVSFSDYAKKGDKNSSKSNKIFFLKHKFKLLFVATLIMGVILITSFTMDSQKWMVWKKDHYQEVPFDIEKYNISKLKIYNEDRILNFKMIIPDCKTIYFANNGDEKLWYGKNNNKELNFFTSLGLHPETGKTLKPITKYMIEKYLCDSYKK